MARTSKRAPAAEPAKPRLEGFENGLQTKNITADALLQSLQNLAKQLSAFVQDEVDLTSIDPILPALSERRLMLHKDKGVKAHLCVCLAEILRIYAPDAPYTQDELADIFQFFFRQLANLGSGSVTKIAYYDEYYHLLESLRDVKSVVIVCDLERWDEVVVEIFKECFGIVRKSYAGGMGAGLPQKVELYIADILSAIIDEATTLPEQVLDMLLAPFTESDPGETKGKLRPVSKPGGSHSPQHRIASKVLNDTTDKIQRIIGSYFTEVLTKAQNQVTYQASSSSRATTPNSVNFDDDEESNNLLTLSSTHSLIKSVHLHAPAVLLNVISKLDEQLGETNVDVRVLTTNTLGAMYASRGTDLIRSHPAVWKHWVSRQNDKEPSVRIAWAGHLRGILYLSSAHPEIQKAICDKVCEPQDWQVRLAVLQVFTTPPLDYETCLRHVSVAVWKEIAGRALDTREAVRKEAAKALGSVWAAAYNEVALNDPSARTHFGWIPGELIGHLYTVTTEVKFMMEEIAHEYLFPLPGLAGVNLKGKEKEASFSQSQGTAAPNGGTIAVETTRVDRLLNTLKFIASSSVSFTEEGALVDRVLGMGALRGARPSLYEHYLASISSGNAFSEKSTSASDNQKDRQQRIIALLTSNLSPNPKQVAKVKEDLIGFAELKDSKLVALARKAIAAGFSSQEGSKAVGKATADFLKRLGSAAPQFVPTMSTFLRKSCLRIVDASMIGPLLDVIKAGPGVVGTESQSQRRTARRDTIHPTELRVQHASEILALVAKWRPELFAEWVPNLVEIMDDPSSSDPLKELTLQALALVAKTKGGRQIIEEKVGSEVHDGIRTLVLGTTNWRLAKYGARYLAFAGKLVPAEGEDSLVNEDVLSVAEAIAEIFSSALEKPLEDSTLDDEYVLCHVVTLTQFARYCNEGFERRSQVFVKYLNDRVIMMSADEPGREDVPDLSEWIDNPSMSAFLLTKIQALKCLRWRMLSLGTPAQKDMKDVVEIAKPVFRMLKALLAHQGSLSQDDAEQDDPRVKARMRLQAASSLLHLCTLEKFEESLVESFMKLVIFIQDSCYEVRHAYLRKLNSLLFQRKLPAKFNVIPFLTAQDPEPDIKNTGTAYVQTSLARMTSDERLKFFEMPFLRFLSVLAQHPDFDNTLDDLKEFRVYFEMYLALVLSQDNISLLYHLAGKGKTVRPKAPHIEEKFWTLCDFAQELMKIRAARRNWNINNYSAPVQPPREAFRPFGTAEEANKNIKKGFLSDDVLNMLQEDLAKAATASGGGASGKRKRPAGGDDKKPKPKKRKSGQEDDEEQHLDPGQSSDVPMEEEDVKPAAKRKAPKPKPKPKKKGKKGESDDDGEDGSDFEGKAGPAKPESSTRPRRSTRQTKTDAEGDVTMVDGEENEEEAPLPKRTPRARKKKAEGDE